MAIGKLRFVPLKGFGALALVALSLLLHCLLNALKRPIFLFLNRQSCFDVALVEFMALPHILLLLLDANSVGTLVEPFAVLTKLLVQLLPARVSRPLLLLH